MDKAQRVHNFHRSTLHALAELTAAAGLDHPNDFRPSHFCRRVSTHEVMTFAELYPRLTDRELIVGARDQVLREAWDKASADSFAVMM